MTVSTQSQRKPRSLQNDAQAWRRDIHQHPELGFQEDRTAAKVAGLLGDFGLEVHTGIGTTGVVGVLRKGAGEQAIGLRADIDALPIHEANTFAHRSIHDGVFHGCGHDGHTAMLLAAARHLAESGEFDGTVCTSSPKSPKLPGYWATSDSKYTPVLARPV